MSTNDSATRAPRVFVSYSHDSREHMDRVLALCDRLRDEGIEAELDQYESVPPKGWPLWTARKVEQADFVLVICTETYRRRFDGREEAGKGLGVRWEGAVVAQALYEAGGQNGKFLPVLFDPGDDPSIPLVLRGTTRFVVSEEEGYEELYRYLTDQPAVPPPVLGSRRSLPPRPRKTEFSSSSEQRAGRPNWYLTPDSDSEEPFPVELSPAETPTPQLTPVDPPPPEPSRVTWINLGLLAAFGLAVSAWLYFFTDIFPTASTALTLGGVFTILSVLMAVAPRAVKERIIKVFQEKVLESRRTWKVMAALAVAFFLPASFRGSLSVEVSDETLCGGEKCRVTVFPASGRGRPETKVFEAEGRKTWRPFTGGFGRNYIVYAPGLPPIDVTVLPFVPRERRLPEKFLLPNLVRIQIADEYLVPEGEVAQSVSFEGIGTPGAPRPYRGGVIWVGAGLPEASRLEADPQDRFVSVPLPLRNGECLHVKVHGPGYGNVLLEVAKRIEFHAKGYPFKLELVELSKGGQCP